MISTYLSLLEPLLFSADAELQRLAPLTSGALENACRSGSLALRTTEENLTESIFSEKTPGFRDLSIGLLVLLRTKVANEFEPLPSTRAWAEATLRITEVLGSKLRKRIERDHRPSTEARTFALQLGSFFIDYYERYDDFRFLNTALKVAEMTWLVQPKKIAKDLAGEFNQRRAGQLALRLLVLSEAAKRRISP